MWPGTILSTYVLKAGIKPKPALGFGSKSETPYRLEQSLRAEDKRRRQPEEIWGDCPERSAIRTQADLGYAVDACRHPRGVFDASASMRDAFDTEASARGVRR